MKSLKNFIALLLIMLSGFSVSQEKNLNTSLIPLELKENSNAVIRNYEINIAIKSQTELIVSEKRIVTVFNKLGKKFVDAYKHYNEDTKISKLKAVIYNSYGNRIKKYSKGDFNDVSAIDDVSLYSDSRVKYLEYTPKSYPYTVVFESEYKNSSTAFIPPFFPVEGYNLSIEKSKYTVHNPTAIPFRKREKNLTKFSVKDSSTDNTLQYSIENQKAIKYERYSINSNELFPSIHISLNNFALKGVKGNASNWKDFGKWMYDNFIFGRNSLPPATVSKVKELVKNIEDPIEKAKIVYDFVQNKTRYISVQIDIGGWMPETAYKVDEVGYGDCKGLTNYTKALLDAIGVTSFYTVVYAGSKRNIDKEFTSIQGNHVILNIPNQQKDIWLECTSQKVPFGFLGDFTDDRNVLVITPEGGIIKRTPKYYRNDNSQSIKADITLEESGNVKATVIRTSKGLQYDDKYYLDDFSEEEKEKYYKSNTWDYINNLEIVSSKISNDKKQVKLTEDLSITIKKYASVRDSSYIFKVNLFNQNNYIPKRYRKRKNDFKITTGFIDNDTLSFKLPKGYGLEHLPSEKKIENEFGTYHLKFKKDTDNKLVYERIYALKDGIFPKEKYKAYRKFIKTVTKYDNLRIELTKNQL
ncbi:hypothetical protein WH52_10545 [Tenacibaculum holothuriorum]|uniref:DUF3857 domain-containing protein n=1 Tax=Tenacibaculum holothuriorum TaxID=1635173 RepID=A0A1Y2PCR6_9FLAO|nr:DUF3857 domain-containing protein [Tenacibaculum holothuriorum]OSY87539.1 hypothetical protein WH52_10545 [Tenacibaculum holothuriorum]